MTRLEEEFTILSSTCTAAVKTTALDPSAERIQALEAELAETKKVSILNTLIRSFTILSHLSLLNKRLDFVSESMGVWLGAFRLKSVLMVIYVNAGAEHEGRLGKAGGTR